MNRIDPEVPPAGYSTWLDFAVDALSPSKPSISGPLIDLDAADFSTIRELARAELVELRFASARRDLAPPFATASSAWGRLAKSLAREVRRAANEVPRDYFAPIVGAIRGISREYRAIDRIRARKKRMARKNRAGQ